MSQKYIFLFCLFFWGISVASAQEKDADWILGAHLIVSLPQSDFANLSKTGEGIGGKVLYRFDPIPNVSPRLDISYISYGEKRNSRADYAGSPFLVETRNESFQMTVGPQFYTRLGRFTPYFAPMGGLYVYRTVVSIPEFYYYYGYPASETTSSLTRWGYNLNAGLSFDLTIGAHLDLSVKYQKITEAVETQNEFEQTIKSDATDISIHFGVVFYLSKK